MTRVLSRTGWALFTYASRLPGKGDGPGTDRPGHDEMAGQGADGHRDSRLSAGPLPFRRRCTTPPFGRSTSAGIYLKWVTRSTSWRTSWTWWSALGMRGFNVTIPHKEIDHPVAGPGRPGGRAGSARSTPSSTTTASWSASNTDVIGVRDDLRAGQRRRQGTRCALVVGAGGASRSVLSYLTSRGSGGRDHQPHQGKAESLAKTSNVTAVGLTRWPRRSSTTSS